jgi:hypothetical protein
MPGLDPATCPAPLQSGPLDIVGDVHGELGALNDLLARLGYAADGSHPDQRHLVFVGDLGDRGPDSPGVIRQVAAMVQAGRAQCVLGNHELSLLRNVPKPGNGWFFATDHDHARGWFRDCQPATAADREAIVAFIAKLPLALERPDLRIVHAAWHPESLAILGRELGSQSVLDVYNRHKATADEWARKSSLAAEAGEEIRQWGNRLHDERADVPLLEALGRRDEYFQMRNPVRVLTSGVEHLADKAFYASGKWRMVDRVAWWERYGDAVPVIFGHYWRWASRVGAELYSRNERNLFDGFAPDQWLGPGRNAFCVDYSVGVRYREREHPRPDATGWLGRLGAVRWPERELVFDDGERLPLR